ncbi:MAG: CapA family protein [Candidatus Saccharimonadales bacterium]
MYRLFGKKRRRISFSITLLSVAVVVCGACAAAWKFVPSPPRPVQPVKVAALSAQPRSLSSNTMFFGNIYFSRYVNDWSMASPLKFAYPFSRLNEFDRPKYDAWIAGLECPTVAGLQQTSAQEDATLSFNCNPQYLPEAAKWFTAFTLANNHTDNQGAAGFAETQKHLDENKIQYFGHPDPRELNDLCDVTSLPARVTDTEGKETKGMLPVAMCGYHGFIRLPQEDALAVMKKYAPYMPVFALPHAGKEYVASPDEIKTKLYRSMIDNGADMVIGDHPHWVQTTESYKGHPIIYSMGNFIFDQQLRPEMTRSAGIQVLLEVKNANPTLLKNWLKLGKSCAAYHDTCLEQAVQQKLTKLPFTYKLGVVGTDDYEKIVKPASAEVQASILQRMNWSQTVSQLQAPYSGL